MNKDKAEALAKLKHVSRELDEGMADLAKVARNPGQHGWRKSLGAALSVPIMGAGAVVVDITEVLVSRIPDVRWSDDSPPPATDDANRGA